MLRLPAHITVDFSNSDESGLVFARMVRASRPLEEGEHVLATDDEDHVCQARVARIDDELAYLELDWDTWTTVELTRATTAAAAVTSLAASYVSNGGADVKSESGGIELVT